MMTFKQKQTQIILKWIDKKCNIINVSDWIILTDSKKLQYEMPQFSIYNNYYHWCLSNNLSEYIVDRGDFNHYMDSSFPRKTRNGHDVWVGIMFKNLTY